MNFLVTLLILSADTPAPIEAASAESAVVFRCDFESETDKNYDGWPDGWTRRRGRGYPDYLKAAIVADRDQPRASGANCLRIELDGGAAALFSPPIAISTSSSYLLEGVLRTHKLRHDVACCSITFLDAQKRPVAVHYCEGVPDAPRWQPARVGPVAPPENAAHAIVGLHLRPTTKADLAGAALFDDLCLSRLPRVSLELGAEHHLYDDPKKVSATCRVSGLVRSEAQVQFELQDAFGAQLATAMVPLVPAKAAAGEETPREEISGTARWNPPVGDYGFYRIRILLADGNQTPLERVTTLAVVPKMPRPRGGEFGWSLPRGEGELGLKTLANLLGTAGVNWVKFPVWYHEKDVARADELAWFAERLGSLGIEMVGILDRPPAEIREQFGSRNELPIASVFIEPALWQGAVDPVLGRLGLKVRWWQLGADHDLSYVGFPGLEKKVAEIRKHLERFGQDMQISVPWDATYEPPAAKNPPWAVLSHLADPAFTAEETQQHLAAARPSTEKRWVMLEPLDRSRYSVETRAHDLVGRMLAAKMQGANGVFIPDPFDAQHGLLNADGTPNELLLPWRTTAHMISGGKYLGSIDLPDGSPNHLFAMGSEAVLVVWNAKPTRETLYLGDDVRQVDIWGRQTTLLKVGHEQELLVSQSPTFVTGVNLPVARWRLAFNFDKSELASTFGRDQQVSFRFRNPFEQGVGGEMTLVAPPVWETTPNKFLFKAASDEELSRNFLLLLRPDANTGDQRIRLDFDVTADRVYKFSVYRTLRVGLGDVTLELATRLTDDGNLVVEQFLTNSTDRPVSFNCYLYAPERRRQRSQVFEQDRGRSAKTYQFAQGEELLGQSLWLRAEEINGPRVLNCRITAER